MKKLTDEEVVKALECCATKTVKTKTCLDCPYFIKHIDCVPSRRHEKDLLDFIHRLQAENKRLKKFELHRIEKMKEQKAEIERLTEEKWQVQDDLDNYHAMYQEEVKARTAKLQKKVDELKFDKELLQKLIDKREKDTAKEIYQELNVHGTTYVKKWIKERYDVEVEQ